MHRIYYFSGTGNTLWVAKRIAALLGDTELIPIASLLRGDDTAIDGCETVGIFCPIYCASVATLVRKFAEHIVKPTGEQPYVYTFFTSGGTLGGAHLVLEQALEKSGIKMNAYYHVVMPSNYIALNDALSPRRIEKTIGKADKKLPGIADDIRAHKSHTPFHIFPFYLWKRSIGKKVIAYIQDYDKYFWLNESCDSCELCEKICPSSNIIMMNGMPTWRGHCELCMACLQWCPKQAIQYRQITKPRTRYHHPAIKAEELFRALPSEGSKVSPASSGQAAESKMEADTPSLSKQ